MLVKTIIFDFSGVLVEEHTLRLETEYKFSALPKPKQQKYIHAIHNSNVGKISSSELLKVMRETLLPQFSIKQIQEFFVESKALPPSKLLQKLRQHHQVLIFSNHQKTWPKIIIKRQGINITGIPFVNSSHVGLRKPHLNYYHYLLKRFNVDPKATIFIDDRQVNLETAKKLGIRTFQYQNNFQQLYKFLKKQKVKGL